MRAMVRPSPPALLVAGTRAVSGHLGAIVRREPVSAVVDFDLHAVGVCKPAHDDAPARGRVTNRVVDEVRQDAGDLVGLALHLREIRRDQETQIDLALACLGAHRGGPLAQQRRDAYRIRGSDSPAPVAPVALRVDQGSEQPDVHQHLVDRVRTRLDHPVAHRLDEQSQGGERVAKVVEQPRLDLELELEIECSRGCHGRASSRAGLRSPTTIATCPT